MDNQQPETPVSLKPIQRQSVLLKSNRRSTFLVRPFDQKEPPVDNPNNSFTRNRELRQEYENVLSINRALETVVDNLEKTKLQVQKFSETVDQTDGLLDIWLSILEKAEESKELIEDSQFQESTQEKRKETEFKAPHNNTRKRRVNE